MNIFSRYVKSTLQNDGFLIVSEKLCDFPGESEVKREKKSFIYIII